MRVLIALATVLLVLFSCKKETFCWECHQTTIYRYTNGQPTTTSRDTTKVCDKTSDQIGAYAKQNTYSKTTSNGITIVSNMNCILK